MFSPDCNQAVFIMLSPR